MHPFYYIPDHVTWVRLYACHLQFIIMHNAPVISDLQQQAFVERGFWFSTNKTSILACYNPVSYGYVR